MTDIAIETTATPPQELAVAAAKNTKRRRTRAARPGMAELMRWVIARGGDGEAVGALSIGGILGRAEISHFWVAEAAQRQGIGSRLLQAAEEAARDAGLVHMLVRAYEFEAPAFFLQRGYEQLAALPGGPQAAGLLWLAKPLMPAAEAGQEPAADAAQEPAADAAQEPTADAVQEPELALGSAPPKAVPAKAPPAGKAGRKRGRRR